MRQLLAILFLLLALPLAAQDFCADRAASPATVAEAMGKLRSLDVKSCLGGTACPTPLCRDIQGWRRSGDVAKDAQAALEKLTAIRNSAASLPATPSLKKLVARIDQWIGLVSTNADRPSAQWKIDEAGLFRETPDEIDFRRDLTAACGGGAASCTTAFRDLVEVATDAELVGVVNGALDASARQALVDYNAALLERWEAYFQRTPMQFPWELAINSERYRRNERRGYNEPPASQWIVLHPAVGYEYASDAEEKFKSAAALEMLGYFTHRVGASLSTVWADRADGNRFGYGVALHWENKVTLGVMRHSGAHGTSILVSPDIEKLVGQSVGRVRTIITRVRQR